MAPDFHLHTVRPRQPVPSEDGIDPFADNGEVDHFFGPALTFSMIASYWLRGISFDELSW
jgi:hypothetical protein